MKRIRSKTWVIGKLVDYGHKLIILGFKQNILFKPMQLLSMVVTLFTEIAILDFLMFISLLAQRNRTKERALFQGISDSLAPSLPLIPGRSYTCETDLDQFGFIVLHQ